MSLLYFYWRDVNYGGSRRNLCDIILAFVYKQMVTSYYSVKLPPFPTKLWESPSLMGHALVSSGDFPLHRDSRGLFRISGWSASSSLYFTWYLLNAESIYGHFPNDVPCSLPEKSGPPFLLLHTGAGERCTPSGQTLHWADTPLVDIPTSEGHCSGRYASYWNAFFFSIYFV